MNMKNTLALVGIAALAACAQAATGESWKSAVEIGTGASKTVALVKEKNMDWESGDDAEDKYFDNGCYFFKIVAKRGKGYTVTVAPVSSSSEIDADISDASTYNWDKEVTCPWWDSNIDDDGTTLRFILASDDWDLGDGTADDPGDDKSVAYFVYISGDIGTKVKITVSAGEQEYEAPAGGSEEKAVSITVDDSKKTYSGQLVNGCFYLKAKLTANAMYKFGTTGGTSSNLLDVGLDSPDGYVLEQSPLEEWTDDNNGGVLAVPSKTATYLIIVTGDSPYGKFSLRYMKAPARKASEHSSTSLGTIKATASTAPCSPGLRNDSKSGYYDKVIDNVLFKMKLTAGNTYVFETSGAKADLLMELYKANGTKAILANRRGFASGHDCKMAYACTADGTYYVGVCQDLDDSAKKEDLKSTDCTISARLVTSGTMDAYDPDDDTSDGATLLVPNFGSGNPATTGSKHGPHTFGATDWVDTYALPVRAGLTYKMVTKLVNSKDASASAWKLGASVYTLSGTKKKEVMTIADLNGTSTRFTPSVNATYYFAVKPTDAQGVDYGAHTFHTLVNSKAGNLGYLNVDIGGATAADGAGWYIKADGKNAVYPAGTLALPAGTYNIVFLDVKGWTAPASKKATVKAGKTTKVSCKYSDEYDAATLSKDAKAGDGSKDGSKVPTLKPSTKTQKASRSLWKADAADWFKFKSAVSTYYTFTLAGGADKIADAVITVYRKSDSAANVVATTAGTGASSLTFLCKEAVNYYVAVTHAVPSSPKDAQYTLKYSMKQVGTVSFAASAYTASDTDASVTLGVVRTDGTDGTVRVRWTTKTGGDEDGAAKAGKDYIPSSGFLTWAAGAKNTKKITIPLLPGLVSQWAENRTFTVELSAVAPEDMEPNEFAPACGTSVATVTIKSGTKKAPGTLQFETKTAAVRAGSRCAVTVTRTGGSDGTVGCVVKQVAGTAKAKKNYVAWDGASEELVWDDGDAEPKTVILETVDAGGGYQTAKKMTLKLSIDKTQTDVAKLGSRSKATVTIVDPNATQDFASYQASCKARTGITVKSTGDWYFDDLDSLVNGSPAKGQSATLTFTLQGPGKFAFTPDFDNGGSSKNKISCVVDKKTQTVKSGKRVVRYLGEGSHTVEIAVSRDKSKPGTGAVATFMSEEDGQPFLWKPLQAVEYVSPLYGEVTNGGGELRWKDDGDDDITYRVALQKSSKKLAADAGSAPANSSGERNSHCLDCVSPTIDSGKTYYWRVDAVMRCEDGSGELVKKGKEMVFSTLAAGMPTMKFRSGSVDAIGDAISMDPEGLPCQISLVQGVYTALRLDTGIPGTNGTEGASFTYALVSGALPNGMSVNTAGRIAGTPSKAGEFKAVVQISKTVTKGSGKKAVVEVTPGGTLPMAFNVRPLGIAAGTYNGLVSTDDARVAKDVNDGLAANAYASVALTAAAKGTITANVKVGDAVHAFKGSHWDGYSVDENGLPFVTATLTATNWLVRSKSNSMLVTNALTVVACCADAAETNALYVPMTAKLDLGLLSAVKPYYVTNVVWSGMALRDNTGVAAVRDQIKSWAGYYTVALAPLSGVEGMQGNGYLTITISSKGQAKVTGVMADRTTAFSCSAACGYLSAEASDTGMPEVLFPVFSSTAWDMFGGWLHFSIREDGTPVVRSPFDWKTGREPLRWIKAVSGATIDGNGFDIEIEPAGGWYDKVVNLHRYYYDRRLAWTVSVADDLASLGKYLLTSTYSQMVAYPGCKGEAEELVLAGDAQSVKNDAVVSAATPKIVTRSADSSLNDWRKSVNPSSLKFSFVRATGVYSGSFQLWGGNAAQGSETKQKKLATCKHGGVLVLARDDNAVMLPEMANLAPGSYTLSFNVSAGGAARTVTASYPFVVKPEEVVPEWDFEGWREELPKKK